MKLTKSQLALGVGICGNLLAIATAALVFLEPPGGAIRPMGIPMLLLLIAVIAAFSGLPLAWSCLWKARAYFVALLAAVLCLSPPFVGYFVFHFFVDSFEYTLKS